MDNNMKTSSQQSSNANQVGVANGEVQPESANGTLLFEPLFRSLRISDLNKKRFKGITAKKMKERAYMKGIAGQYIRKFNVWYVKWDEDGYKREGKVFKWDDDPGAHRYRLFEMEEVSEKKLTGKMSKSKGGKDSLQKFGDILYVMEGSKVYYHYAKLYKSWKKYDEQWYKNKWYKEEHNRERTNDRIKLEDFIEKLAKEKYAELFPKENADNTVKLYRFIYSPAL